MNPEVEASAEARKRRKAIIQRKSKLEISEVAAAAVAAALPDVLDAEVVEAAVAAATSLKRGADSITPDFEDPTNKDDGAVLDAIPPLDAAKALAPKDSADKSTPPLPIVPEVPVPEIPAAGTVSDEATDPPNPSDKKKKTQIKYNPDVPMDKAQLAAWRREARRVRNRESAAASRQRIRSRITELEDQVDEWKTKYENALEKLNKLEGRAP